uniref:Uncharacterized protein n=1 Tax=Leersia perrieri TaxID=77586 RepID=A0A0D9XDQ1_9ORYZ
MWWWFCCWCDGEIKAMWDINKMMEDGEDPQRCVSSLLLFCSAKGSPAAFFIAGFVSPLPEVQTEVEKKRERVILVANREEARRYVNCFLPRRGDQIGVEARTVLKFITYLIAIDDIAQGKRPVCHLSLLRFLLHRDSVEWQFLRIRAGMILEDLILKTPEFSHLLRLPRYPLNPQSTIPLWFSCRRRHQRKIIGRIPASLLAHRFLANKRCASPRKELDSCSKGIPGKKRSISSANEGIPGAPVLPCIGKNYGSANAVTEHLSQEDCYSESVASAEHPPTTGAFCPMKLVLLDL